MYAYKSKYSRRGKVAAQRYVWYKYHVQAPLQEEGE